MNFDQKLIYRTAPNFKINDKKTHSTYIEEITNISFEISVRILSLNKQICITQKSY
jgi:hypothetical protein